MIELKTVNGNPVRVNWATLSRLRYQMDWQLRWQNYDPASVTAACMQIDECVERINQEKFLNYLKQRDQPEAK